MFEHMFAYDVWVYSVVYDDEFDKNKSFTPKCINEKLSNIIYWP